MNSNRADAYSYRAARGDLGSLAPFVGAARPTLFMGEGIVGAVGGALDLVRRAVARVQRAIAIRQTIGMLQALDVRTLEDIGVNRCEIHSVALRAIDKARPVDETASIIA